MHTVAGVSCHSGTMTDVPLEPYESDTPVGMPDSALAKHVQAAYSPAEYPALAHQITAWSRSQPLAGLTVLDATPVFTNTLAKYLALQVAGAEVTVSAHRAIPGDPVVIAALPAFGVAVADEETLRSETFDIVSDCAGTHSDVGSRFGYVELTRSGVAVYAESPRPVFVADSGRIKRIETSLGTGDGFVRGMAALGHPIPHGPQAEAPKVVIFGGGKVGSGVAAACAAIGAHVVVIDPDTPALTSEVRRISPDDAEAVQDELATAWCVVAATGITAALQPWAQPLLASGALLANMGATDEFGPTVPASRVLHSKVAVNFVLDEPTRLRYLDPTMALTNAGAVELRHGRVPAGPSLPPTALEDELLDAVRQHGAVAAELSNLVPVAPSNLSDQA